nr:hypothetical protein Q903MT_gene3469 [Picea sitchensis]
MIAIPDSFLSPSQVKEKPWARTLPDRMRKGMRVYLSIQTLPESTWYLIVKFRHYLIQRW